jgi:redox-sensitive bicupin YhaK (pirin superfamily)
MTAGSGLLHEEKHSAAFTRTGGEFHVVQLWVNLPAKDKVSPPGYQTLLASDIPEVVIGESTVRVIAGSAGDVVGPARTHTPMNVWDVGLSGEVSLAVPSGHNAMVIVLAGSAEIAGETLNVDELAIFEREGDSVLLSGSGRVMVLTGEPIDEPIAAYGPFVMNTQEEIRETINEFQSGKYGSL